jgi:osmotically-inducible protein OsmY
MNNSRAELMTAFFATAVLCLPQISLAAAQTHSSTPDANASSQAGTPAASDASARLDKKQFHNVKVSVDQGTATLTGTVDLYENKIDAERRIHKAKGVTAVRDLIEVAGPSISDEELQYKLRDKLAYDRVFYGNAFNAITLNVHNGAVTLGGHALSLFSRDSALALVSTYPGVKNVTDEIAVDPVSMLDNQIRMQVYRAVYGYPSLNRYAMDPAKPIRISVQNGNVELFGMVDNQGDKETAFIRANGVPGVFSVKNYLVIPIPPAKAQK